MDPNTAFSYWKEAVSINDRFEAAVWAENLANWMDGGGFKPDWTDQEAAFFFEWLAGLDL